MRILLTLSIVLATVSISRGQGMVNFANSSTTRISTNSPFNGPATGLMTGPIGAYYFALYVAPSTQNTASNSLAGWTYVGMGTNTATAGRMNGNTTTDPGVPVPGYAIGSSTADFVVIGWSASLGTDPAAVVAWWNNGSANGPAPPGATGVHPFFGISAVAQDQILGGGGQPIPAIFSATLIPNMVLNDYAIPEPGCFALLAVGSASFLAYRRKTT